MFKKNRFHHGDTESTENSDFLCHVRGTVGERRPMQRHVLAKKVLRFLRVSVVKRFNPGR